MGYALENDSRDIENLTYTIIQDSLGVYSMQGTVLLQLYYLFPQTSAALITSRLWSCVEPSFVPTSQFKAALTLPQERHLFKILYICLFSVPLPREDWGGSLALLPTLSCNWFYVLWNNITKTFLRIRLITVFCFYQETVLKEAQPTQLSSMCKKSKIIRPCSSMRTWLK